MRMTTVSLGKLTLLSCLLVTTACGKTEELPNASLAAALKPASPTAQALSVSTQVYESLPKVLLAMEELQQDIRKLRLTPLTATPSAPAVGTQTASRNTGSQQPSNPSRPARPPAASTSNSPPARSNASTPSTPRQSAPDSNAELQQILTKISKAPFVSAQVEKTERNLSTGKTGVIKIKMYSKQPNLVKLEVLESSSGSTGAKVVYTSNEGNKAKVRPGGAMSFITTELPKTDDRLASVNGYTFDDIDLFGVQRRLSQGYQAELVGKTQVSGKAVNVLKLTTRGAHGMGSHVDYEYFGYDPETFEIRLWEIYAKGEEQPYYRMVMNLEFPTTLPESTFKL